MKIESHHHSSKVLKEKKEKLHISLSELANDLKVTRGFAWFLVEGRRAVPTDLFNKVCKRLQIPRVELFNAMIDDFEDSLRTSIK